MSGRIDETNYAEVKENHLSSQSSLGEWCEDVHLHGIYQSHINEDSEARQRLHEAVERLTSGENITLVCYEEEGESCHRHMLVDILRERVEKREDCRFKLSA